MDEELYEVKQTTDRHRSPSFTQEEIQALLTLIERYKIVILNKSTTASASHAKELAWMKIAKIFNSQALGHKRDAERLKTKWDNLKRTTKKLSNNLMDMNNDDITLFTHQVVTLMGEDINTDIIDMSQEIVDELTGDKLELLKDKEADPDQYPNHNEIKEQSDESDGECRRKRDKILRNRSQNFSPQETSILLKCIRAEKKHVLSKLYSTDAIKQKNDAWERITEAFNKRSPQKRTTSVLRRKFFNLRGTIRKIYPHKHFKNKHEKLVEDDSKEIKAEPYNGDKIESDIEFERNKTEADDDLDNDNDINDTLPDSATNFPETVTDPLITVLNSDSGLGSSSFMGAYNFSDNEVTKLKKELLQYQLETAKLERQRVQEALKAESAAWESLAVERALKLRTARLETLAAEIKLPASHPGLQYNFEELQAKAYMNQ